MGILAVPAISKTMKPAVTIDVTNYTQTVNVIGCIKTSKTSAEFATTGQVLKLYRNRFGQIPVEVGGTPGPLNVAAAWTEDRKALTIAIVNPTRVKYSLNENFKVLPYPRMDFAG